MEGRDLVEEIVHLLFFQQEGRHQDRSKKVTLLMDALIRDRENTSMKKRALVSGYNFLHEAGYSILVEGYVFLAHMLKVPGTHNFVHQCGMAYMRNAHVPPVRGNHFGSEIVCELDTGDWTGQRAIFAYNAGLFHALYGEPFSTSWYYRTPLHSQIMINAEAHYERTKFHCQSAVFAWLLVWKHSFKAYFPRQIALEIAEYVWWGRFEGFYSE